MPPIVTCAAGRERAWAPARGHEHRRGSGILDGMPIDSPASEALPGRRRPAGPYRICLVCLGNICRSPMAEAVLRAELARAGLSGAVPVESAGTGDWHVGERMYGPARSELDRRGYDGSGHRARQIEPSWLARYDLVLAMDADNLADLRRMAGVPAAGRIRLLRSFDPGLMDDDPFGGQVPDPYGGTPAQYAQVFDLIEAAVKGLVQRLVEFCGSQPAGR
jgi:protein-tyrosine phosphatase